MLYLIDGYNLLHAMGVPESHRRLARLDQARGTLLGLLGAAHGDGASAVTVVFDAANAPRGASSEQYYKGIHVVFAVHEEEADDLIEVLIRQASVPRQLTVVSDDHRIQQAARRRRCTTLGCQAYLEWLEKKQRRPAPVTPPASAKPQTVTGAERDHWLREFADLENDPALKELSDPFGFLENEP
jgi:uncharacterized protein